MHARGKITISADAVTRAAPGEEVNDNSVVAELELPGKSPLAEGTLQLSYSLIICLMPDGSNHIEWLPASEDFTL
ncbi:hypothetical protein V6N13_084423 [Hibiscus sabdariffa]|uniref:Uncharacterized protein n=1 Tax=Hibiscus sabdariffa TaxID=183260 RepID=A0ABR2T1T2_9ROSI